MTPIILFLLKIFTEYLPWRVHAIKIPRNVPMKRCLMVLMFLVYFAGCHKVTPPGEINYAERYLIQFDADEYSQIVWEYVTELKYDHRLHLENALVCFDGESKIRLQFITQHILELCDARALLVDVVEGLLDRLNYSKDASASLSPYPLTADQIEISIDFESFYGIYDDPFYIGYVALEQGMSYFYAFNLKNKKLDIWNSRSEPYFKSLSFVKFQRAGEEKYEMTHPKPKPFASFPDRYIGSQTLP